MKYKFFKFLFFLMLFLFFKNNVFSNLENFDFSYLLQRPSYIDKQENGIYKCDNSKEECKVNFKLVDNKQKDISSKYRCEIITSFDIGEEKNKCNPNTIVIPENTKEKIIFKVIDKNNEKNFLSKEIFIENLIKLEDFDFKYLLQRPSYIIRESENEFRCKKSENECKLNLKFVDINEKDFSSSYKCEILTDFDIGEEKNKCNPNTIIIPKNFTGSLILKVSKNNNKISKEKEIFINNNFQRNYTGELKIIVQGRKSKYKRIKANGIKCLTYNKCSINFTAGKNIPGVMYEWNFGNGKKYYGYNPKTIKYSPGKYQVKLRIVDNYGNEKIQYFYVKVKKKFSLKEKKIIKNKINNLIFFKKNIYLKLNKKTKITKIIKKSKRDLVKSFSKKKIKKLLTVENIFGKGVKITRKKVNKKKIAKNDKLKKNSKKGINFKKKKIFFSKKEKLLKKNIKLHISFQKKALKISGQTFAKSKVEIKIGKQKFKTFSNNSGKYVLKINSLTAGKYKILASVYNNKGVLIARKKSREKIISKKYISQLNHYKYKKYLSLVKKKYKKHKKKIKSKFKKYKISILSPPKKEIKLNKFNITIFIINILVTILISILTSLILIRKKII